MYYFFYIQYIYIIYGCSYKLEKISNNINNVLALRMNQRFVELLKSPSPILQVRN